MGICILCKEESQDENVTFSKIKGGKPELCKNCLRKSKEEMDKLK
jgi:hypothetical protein